MNHGQLYGREHDSKCADAMRYRKHAENSEDTRETADGPSNGTLRELADRNLVPRGLSNPPTDLTATVRGLS